MDIYIVQTGDTVQSIADRFQVTTARIILDNGLQTPAILIPGQALIITYPSQTYTIKEGDTLSDIAEAFGITLNQLLRNNPYLSERQYIYPGEDIIISYDTKGHITANGHSTAFINEKTLKKTLPFLTYLSIFNYRVSREGEVIVYSDDTSIIQMAKDYGTAPLMLLTTLTPLGETNLQATYDLLLNEVYQNSHIENVIHILKSKGYYGINLTLLYLNATNQKYYESFLLNYAERLAREGFAMFLTIPPNFTYENNKLIIEQVDYTILGSIANNINFMEYKWGYNYGPPSPVISVSGIKELLDYSASMIPSEILCIGMSTLGYDWELPYMTGFTKANSLTIDSCYALAAETNATIQFDEPSQTPYFQYIESSNLSAPNHHIVWFVDARSVNAVTNLIFEYNLNGIGIWNIMNFNAQIWSTINSQYEIIKL